MPNTDDALLRPGTVARLLGVSSTRVRQLDRELEPLRLDDESRVYLQSSVDRYLGKIAARGGR